MLLVVCVYVAPWNYNPHRSHIPATLSEGQAVTKIDESKCETNEWKKQKTIQSQPKVLVASADVKLRQSGALNSALLHLDVWLKAEVRRIFVSVSKQ